MQAKRRKKSSREREVRKILGGRRNDKAGLVGKNIHRGCQQGTDHYCHYHYYYYYYYCYCYYYYNQPVYLASGWLRRVSRPSQVYVPWPVCA